MEILIEDLFLMVFQTIAHLKGLDCLVRTHGMWVLLETPCPWQATVYFLPSPEYVKYSYKYSYLHMSHL